MLTVCSWCKRESYHAICEECFDAYEQKTVARDIARRERARGQNTKADQVVAAPALRLVRE